MDLRSKLTILKGEAWALKETIKDMFTPAPLPKFDPTVHLTIKSGDVVMYRNRVWVARGTFPDGVRTLLTRVTIKTEPQPGEVDLHENYIGTETIDVVGILTFKNAQVIDRNYMRPRDYSEIISRPYKHKLK
jgi:hypothetical protein